MPCDKEIRDPVEYSLGKADRLAVVLLLKLVEQPTRYMIWRPPPPARISAPLDAVAA